MFNFLLFLDNYNPLSLLIKKVNCYYPSYYSCLKVYETHGIQCKCVSLVDI